MGQNALGRRVFAITQTDQDFSPKSRSFRVMFCSISCNMLQRYYATFFYGKKPYTLGVNKRGFEELGSELGGLRKLVSELIVNIQSLENRLRTMPFIAAGNPVTFTEGGDTEAVHANSNDNIENMASTFRFITWNTQKRNPARARFVLKDLRQRYGKTCFAALQEVPRWGTTSHHGLAVRSKVGCDCAVV